MSTLAQAAARFAESYHARPALVEEQRGWSRTFLLRASDADDAVAVRVEDGRVVEIAAAPQGEADVVITADAATLQDVLELRRSPNEPYLFGELTVRGPEADFARLDYIVEILCPA